MSTRGHAWLLDVHPPSLVRDTPPEKRDLLWLKVRGEVERLFGADSPLLVNPPQEDLSHLVTQAEVVCNLVRQHASYDEHADSSVIAATAVMQRALRSLYHRLQVQQYIADCICALVDKGMTTADEVMRGGGNGFVLTWAVWKASQEPVTAIDVRRLWILRDAFSIVDWGADGAHSLLGYCSDLPSLPFLYHEHSAGVLKTVFAQHIDLTVLLHRRIFCLLVTKAEGDADRDAIVNMLIDVWVSLEGVHRQDFEDEVVQKWVDCTIASGKATFDVCRAVLRRLAAYGGPGKKTVTQSLRRLLRNSELFAAFDSPNALYRCNAAAVLGDHYPINPHSGGKEAVEQAKADQMELLKKSLCDACDVVRCHAVGAVCGVLGKHWERVPASSSIPVLHLLFTKLAFDREPAVRLACLQQIRSSLLTQPIAHEHLRPLLRHLKHLDDGNARVRVLYVNMLGDLLQLKFVPLGEVVDEADLVRRIGLERSAPVREGLVRLLRPSLWVERATKGTDGASFVKQLLKIVATAPLAAVSFYGGVAKSTRDHPGAIAGLIAACIKWVVSARVSAKGRAPEHVLVTVHAMLKGVAPRIASKHKQVRDHLGKVFSDDVLKVIATRFPSLVVQRLIIDVRTHVREEGGDEEMCGTLLQSLQEQDVVSGGADWKLTLERCVQQGAVGEVLGWLSDEIAIGSAEQQKRAARILTELMSNSAARADVCSPGWVAVRNALQSRARLTCRQLTVDTDTSAPETVEALNHLVLWTAESEAAAFRETAQARKRREKTNDDSDSSDSEAEQEAEEQPKAAPECKTLTSHLTWVLGTMLPDVQEILSSSEKNVFSTDHGTAELRLVAAALAEQGLVFLANGIRCGHLTEIRDVTREIDPREPFRRGKAKKKPRLEMPEPLQSLGAALERSVSAERQLIPRAFECVEAAVDMHQCKLFDGDGGVGAVAGRIVREAVAACDALGPVKADDTLADAVESRDLAWKGLAELGLHVRNVGSFGSVLCNDLADGRTSFDFLWRHCLEKEGRTAASFVIAELAARHRPFSGWLQDGVMKMLTQKADSKGPTKSEVRTASFLFAACLCSPLPPPGKTSADSVAGRALAKRLHAFKVHQLDPFFQQQKDAEVGDRGDGDGTARPLVLDSDEEDSTDGTAMSGHQHLSSLLDILPWASAAGGTRAVEPSPAVEDVRQPRKVRRTSVEESS